MKKLAFALTARYIHCRKQIKVQPDWTRCKLESKHLPARACCSCVKGLRARSTHAAECRGRCGRSRSRLKGQQSSVRALLCLFPCHFLCFMRVFWNQKIICVSQRSRTHATSTWPARAGHFGETPRYCPHRAALWSGHASVQRHSHSGEGTGHGHPVHCWLFHTLSQSEVLFCPDISVIGDDVELSLLASVVGVVLHLNIVQKCPVDRCLSLLLLEVYLRQKNHAPSSVRGHWASVGRPLCTSPRESKEEGCPMNSWEELQRNDCMEAWTNFSVVWASR